MRHIFILVFFFSCHCYSENNIEYTVDITFIEAAGKEDVMNFKNKLIYRNTKATASWKDNLGDYGIIKCLGNYVSYEKLGTNLTLYCQGTNKDGEVFWLTMKRNSKDYDGGVGKSEYLYGEGKFKKLVNTNCIYAVEISEEFSILKQKCKLNN